MENSDKTFVVVAVLSLIFIGLFAYLFFIDRKLRNLEKKVNEKNTDQR